MQKTTHRRRLLHMRLHRVGIWKLPCNMLDGNAHESATGLAANVDPVVGNVDEDDVDVEGWEADVRVQRGDVLGEGSSLRGGEGRGVREDAP